MQSIRRFVLFPLLLCALTGCFFLGRMSALPQSEATAEPLAPLSVSPAPAASAMADGRIELNAATEEELCLLPGIGPALAKRILEYRDAHGGFCSAGELTAVPGIGDATVAALRPYITVP